MAIGGVGVGFALLAAVMVFATMSDTASALVVAIAFGFPAALVVVVGRRLGRATDHRDQDGRRAAAHRVSSAEAAVPTSLRPSYETFLGLVASLSDADAREVAELERVPDWRRERDLSNLFEPFLRRMPDETVQGQRSARDRAALERTLFLLGREGVDAARRRARAALRAATPSWPRMRWHSPLHAAALVGVAVVATVVILSLGGILAPPADLAATIIGSAIAAAALLWSYLLPPSARDLRIVIERAAVAHAAGEPLEDDHFAQLADGFYAVLDGRWRRRPRPYGMWTCLFVGMAVLLLLGGIVAVAGPG